MWARLVVPDSDLFAMAGRASAWMACAPADGGWWAGGFGAILMTSRVPPGVQASPDPSRSKEDFSAGGLRRIHRWEESGGAGSHHYQGPKEGREEAADLNHPRLRPPSVIQNRSVDRRHPNPGVKDQHRAGQELQDWARNIQQRKPPPGATGPACYGVGRESPGPAGRQPRWPRR